MATCVENCRLCHESLPPKHRRTIFTETFGLTNQLIEVLGYIPRAEDGMSKYLCGFCFTKLNKLSKIEFDISHRLEALKNEKFEILKMLRARYVQIARPIVHECPLKIKLVEHLVKSLVSVLYFIRQHREKSRNL